MNVKTSILEVLQKALAELGIEGVIPTLERPADMAHGDYATNVALTAAKQAGKNPRELAEAILEVLRQTQDNLNLEKIEVAGPGFINFHLSRDYFLENLKEVKEDCGKG